MNVALTVNEKVNQSSEMLPIVYSFRFMVVGTVHKSFFLTASCQILSIFVRNYLICRNEGVDNGCWPIDYWVSAICLDACRAVF